VSKNALALRLRPEPGRSFFAAQGRFEVRLTRAPGDIAAAQRLRYRVFYEEMRARPSPLAMITRRDTDRFDAICEHLLVLDRHRPAGDRVVGTYRLLRQDVAMRHGGFYSAGEYDMGYLLETCGAAGRMLEVGRSCVHADYRNQATIQLLWRAIAAYIAEHRITHLFGCASLKGTDPDRLDVPLSYLYHQHLAPPPVRVRALPSRWVNMARLPPAEVPWRAAVAAMPPLIKGYLRLGAYVGDGAVVDRQFGTTDVFILLPVERIASRYLTHFEREHALAAE
jgi:L-ornithine Nalpha-acyltransferase